MRHIKIAIFFILSVVAVVTWPMQKDLKAITWYTCGYECDRGTCSAMRVDGTPCHGRGETCSAGGPLFCSRSVCQSSCSSY